MAEPVPFGLRACRRSRSDIFLAFVVQMPSISVEDWAVRLVLFLSALGELNAECGPPLPSPPPVAHFRLRAIARCDHEVGSRVVRSTWSDFQCVKGAAMQCAPRGLSAY